MGGIFLMASAVVIFVFNGRLEPYTTLFAHGQAAWSSPAAAIAGIIGGRTGVQIFACISALLLGGILGYRLGLLAPIGVLLSPPGWSIGYAGADAAGAFGSTFLFEYKWLWLITGVLHLEAFLVCLTVYIYTRFSLRFVGVVAIGVGMIPQALFFHIQIRYLLPGVVLFVLWRRRGRELSVGIPSK